VKRKQKKRTAGEPKQKSPPLNLSGVKFEDAVRAMLESPPVHPKSTSAR
jgi:hypothetical protein